MASTREIVGLELSYDMNELLPKGFKNASHRISDSTLNYAKEFACCHHFGFAVPKDELQTLAEKGIGWAASYFQSGGSVDADGWFRPFSRSILLCLLSNSFVELRSICEWARADTSLEDLSPQPAEFQQAYLVLASTFQATKSQGFELVLKSLRACRKRSVKPFVKAIDAVLQMDQKSFAEGIEQMVEEWCKQPKPKPTAFFMEDWLPLDASVVYLAGLNAGMTIPRLEPRIAAYLLTPDSAGFSK